MKENQQVTASLYSIMKLPLNMSVFICHSSETNRLVEKVQKELTNQNNQIGSLAEYRIRDWHNFPNIQKKEEADCQDIINGEIDKADIIIFIVKERIGHFLLREWFYSIQKLNTKSILLFLDKKSYHKQDTKNKIKWLLNADHYLEPKEYLNTKDLIEKIQKTLYYLSGIKIIENAQRITVSMSQSQLEIYSDQIDYLLKQLPQMGLKSFDGPLSERFRRLMESSTQKRNCLLAERISNDILKIPNLIPSVQSQRLQIKGTNERITQESVDDDNVISKM